MELKAYQSISDLRKENYPLYYSFTSYELLRSDKLRKGHLVKNVGQVPVVVGYGFELIGLYPPYPVIYEVTLYPSQSYLFDIPEVIPLAGRWLEQSAQFGLGEVLVTEFL